MSSRVKSQFWLPFLIISFFVYFSLQTLTSNQYNFLTPLDSLIPTIYEFIWFYHSLIPVMAITIFMLIKKKNVFYISFISSLIAVIILSIFYALFPSYYPRPELGAVTSISEWLVNFTRSIDGANNTFPSSHVTFAIITYLTIHEITDIKNNSYIKFIYTVWAMLICMSTLVLKQHYIVDVICAFFVATICFSIAKYLIKGGFLNSILELET